LDKIIGIEEALADCARFYRKALWRDVGAYAEIWLEKDALAGVVCRSTGRALLPSSRPRARQRPKPKALG
jgi:hypothetical protein